MLRTYALSPEFIRRALRRVFWRFQAITTLSFLVFGLYLASSGGAVNWPVAGPIITVIALAYFFIIYFNYRQQLRLLYSVRIELDNSSITYRQLGDEPVRVMRADLTGVQEKRNGLQVETVDPRVTLLVPFGLANNGNEDVWDTLNTWVGIEDSGFRRRRFDNTLLLAGLVGSLFILFFANTLWMILPLGAVLAGYGVYTEHRLVRTHDSSPGQLRSYNRAFSFLLFVILMKSCLIGLLAMIGR